MMTRNKPDPAITGGGETMIRAYKSTKKELSQLTAFSAEIFGEDISFMNAVLYEIVHEFHQKNAPKMVKSKK